MGMIMASHCLIYLVFLGLTALWAAWSVRKNQFFNRNKMNAFECGFDSLNTARVSFSIRFFFLLILFLVFDVELTVLLQFPLFLEESLWSGFITLVVFLLLLIFGLNEEWRRGILNWKS